MFPSMLWPRDPACKDMENLPSRTPDKQANIRRCVRCDKYSISRASHLARMRYQNASFPNVTMPAARRILRCIDIGRDPSALPSKCPHAFPAKLQAALSMPNKSLMNLSASLAPGKSRPIYQRCSPRPTQSINLAEPPPLLISNTTAKLECRAC